MAQLDATISGTSSNAYLTVAQADDLMDGFPPVVQSKWDNLEGAEGFPDVSPAHEWMLIRAATLIDAYKGWGPKKATGQALAFPRSVDASDDVPSEVKAATMAVVELLLDEDLVPIKRLQEEGVTSASILGQSVGLAEERSGLPAGARRQLDKLARRHWPTPRTTQRDDPPDTLVSQDEDGSFFGGG
jgi:hypothetical protein